MVSICEGLRELGFLFYGSSDYWFDPESKEYLIRKAPEGFEADVHVYNTYYFHAFPEAITQVDYSRKNILIDREDGLYGEYCNSDYRKFDLILRTHYNGYINYKHYHPNIQPWAFGLSSRIVKALDQSRHQPLLEQTYLSFRLGHELRGKAVRRMSPGLAKRYEVYDGVTTALQVANPEAFTAEEQLYWEQSGHRHDPAYYKRLNNSLLTFAFGGFIFPRPFAATRLSRPFQAGTKVISSLMKALGKDDSFCYFIDQYDSWRLWESFYSNSCPVHMDFEDWKFILPEMPQNKVHYLGVKRFEFEQSAAEITSIHPDDLLGIGQEGRKWSVTHYGPVAVARRFCERVAEIGS
jgi:hypothetical protein